MIPHSPRGACEPGGVVHFRSPGHTGCVRRRFTGECALFALLVVATPGCGDDAHLLATRKSGGTGPSAGGDAGTGSLPELPPLDDVTVITRGDSAIVEFSAMEGAKDYRIYVLPAEDDVRVGPAGEVTIRN